MIWHDEYDRYLKTGKLDPIDRCLCDDCEKKREEMCMGGNMSDKRKRDEQIGVRLSLDELMKIADNALDAGYTSIAAYLRYLGLKGGS